MSATFSVRLKLIDGTVIQYETEHYPALYGGGIPLTITQKDDTLIVPLASVLHATVTLIVPLASVLHATVKAPPEPKP